MTNALQSTPAAGTGLIDHFYPGARFDSESYSYGYSFSAEGAWTEHVADTIANSLLLQADSWFMGANTPGKKRTFLMYAGGSPAYRKKCDEVAAKGYDGFVFH
jgi:hypothetical protein